MDSLNPYASPEKLGAANPVPKSAFQAWRSGGLLVVTANARLPSKCIKCNSPTDGQRHKFQLAWYPFYFNFAILLGVLPFLILFLAFKKNMLVEACLCSGHQRWRSNILMAAAVLLTIGLAMIFFNNEYRPAYRLAFIGCGLGLILVTVLVALFTTRMIVARRIDEQYAWVHGAGEEYLRELPEFSHTDRT